MSEHQEQAALFGWARVAAMKWPDLNLMFAIPNGGHRHKAVAAKLKAEGVKAGVPDVFLPVARGGHHGLFIEMKTEKGAVSKNQEIWLENLANQGYKTAICHGWESAKFTIETYLKG